MENVIIASFDPTVFGVRTLSDLESFRNLKAPVIYRDFPRLCTAHLALKVPIVLATAANIRKYQRVKTWPQEKAIYYDCYTRCYEAGPQVQDKTEIFRDIINRTPTDDEMVRYFQRCHNISKKNYTRTAEHRHMPRARPLGQLTNSDDELDESIIYDNTPRNRINIPSFQERPNKVKCPEEVKKNHDEIEFPMMPKFSFTRPNTPDYYPEDLEPEVPLNKPERFSRRTLLRSVFNDAHADLEPNTDLSNGIQWQSFFST